MIKSREEILKINPVFTNHIINLQNSLYQPSVYKPGEEVYDYDLKKIIVLSIEEAKSLTKMDKDYFEVIRDKNPHPNFHLDYDGSLNFTCKQKNTTSYINALTIALENLGVYFNQEYIIILADRTIPWLCEKTDFEETDFDTIDNNQLSNALKNLKEKIDNAFNGGFLLEREELKEFIPDLFWLETDNTLLTRSIIGYSNCSFVMNICEYGGLHIHFYNTKEKNEVVSVLKSSGFTEVEDCNGYVDFDTI